MNIPYQNKMLSNGLYLIYIDCKNNFYFNNNSGRISRFVNINQLSELIISGKILC